ncbi:MAG: PQQ-binding-like beta-propeller repeat protein, partial [Candidatus Eremiobacteraeota bacterium]|nr:PQQ-binding-like beta-propeller repeat protein [Candidatus Eremiobacteraeota bacterium]
MRRIALAALVALALSATVFGGYRVTSAQQRVALADMATDSGQWVMPGQNYANVRHSALDEIKTDNVANLKAAWTMSTGATRGHEGQPLVVGDTMYYESAYPNHVYAIDLNDYHIKWQYTPKEDSFATSVACCDLVNRGVAYGDGKIIEDALDGQVIALDANSGHVVWNVKNSDAAMGQTLTSAPLIVKDKYVVVGVSGGEYGVRGYLTAYDIASGKRVWRAYSEGPDSDTRIGADFSGPKNAGISTWQGEQWKVGGGTTWGWYSYDPQLNL